MTRVSERVRYARDQWQYRGELRPSFAEVPGPGQESVWDYPRPPEIRPEGRRVEIRLDGKLLIQTVRAVRLLETASPPCFYVPPADVEGEWLRESREAASSFCEWKGAARYFDVVVGDRTLAAAMWSYPDPYPEYEGLAGFFSAYPAQLECTVDGVAVVAQPGGFYGGWVTPEIVGPMKGDPGSGSW